MVKTVRICDRCGAEIPDKCDTKMSVIEIMMFQKGEKKCGSYDLCEHCTFLFSEYFIKRFAVPGKDAVDEFCEKVLGIEGVNAQEET